MSKSLNKRRLWQDALIEAVFPSDIYCITCGSVIDSSRYYSLCDNCIEKINWVGKHTCSSCGKPLAREDNRSLCYDCRSKVHYFDKGFTCAGYGLYERSLMMDMKYRGKSYIGRIMGKILADRFYIAVDTYSALSEIDYIVPVPVHKSRMRERGYNQAAIMAKELAEEIGVPVKQGILKRTRGTRAMKGLNPQERQGNVEEAFSVTSVKEPNIRGKRILIIDDIYTTGSTMDACSKALKNNGARAVYVMTFAAGKNVIPGSSQEDSSADVDI